ncbi:hypothetical protein [Sphingobium xenophagum]|uniref:hypothetical protein n=1 Tax=Sphingobium xenophagum TaxID=121428 RepID=UPI0012FC117B|nr:hypothetical protein [Sphingobium xenophagum]
MRKALLYAAAACLQINDAAFAQNGATFTPPPDYVEGEPVEVLGEAVPRLSAADQTIYTGTYTCEQGLTKVSIDLSNIGYGLGGTFNFGGGRVPYGSYEFDLNPLGGNRYQIDPVRWRRQPAGFRMVGATVTISNGQLSGNIDDRDCTTIRALAPAAVAKLDPSSGGRPPSASNTSRQPAMESKNGSPSGSALDQMLDRVVQADSRTWGFNRYVSGSMSGSRYLSGGSSSKTYVAQGNYKYVSYAGGISSGWVKIKVANSSLQCIEFHDQAGNCRAPGASLSAQALVGVLAAGAAGAGSSGGGETPCNPNDLVLVGDQWQPAKSCH